MHTILVIRLYFQLNALHVSDYISTSSGATFISCTSYLVYAGICRYVWLFCAYSHTTARRMTTAKQNPFEMLLIFKYLRTTVKNAFTKALRTDWKDVACYPSSSRLLPNSRTITCTLTWNVVSRTEEERRWGALQSGVLKVSGQTTRGVLGAS